jgi:predicted Rossmann fold flavoprotein
LSHSPLEAEAFESTHPLLVRSILARVDGDAILSFFRGLGLRIRIEEGRVYPITNQAATVLRLLEREVGTLGIDVETGWEAASLEAEGAGFTIATADGKTARAHAVVLAGGGRSYPALGSNGSGYDLAHSLGHRIVQPVPSAVPLVVKDRLCHLLQGLKLSVRVRALIDGREAASADGDLLFTAYGLSGTAVLDVSDPISAALNRDGDGEAVLAVDFVPFLSFVELTDEIRNRITAGWGEAELVSGLLPEKLAAQAPSLIPPGPDSPEARAGRLARALKDKRFAVLGTRGWNEAEFTSGGVDAREVNEKTLESKKQSGLFLAGEILDVQGPRGGYNLAWAWGSGLVAGQEAAKSAAAHSSKR